MGSGEAAKFVGTVLFCYVLPFDPLLFSRPDPPAVTLLSRRNRFPLPPCPGGGGAVLEVAPATRLHDLCSGCRRRGRRSPRSRRRRDHGPYDHPVALQKGRPGLQPDDYKLGTVVDFAPDAMHPTHLVVEKKLLIHHDCRVPTSTVCNYEGSTVYLDLTKDQVVGGA